MTLFGCSIKSRSYPAHLSQLIRISSEPLGFLLARGLEYINQANKTFSHESLGDSAMHPSHHGRSVACYSSFVFLVFSVGCEWRIHTIAFRSSFNKSAGLERVRFRMQICLRNACCVCKKRRRPPENNAEQQGALYVEALGHAEKITHPRWLSFPSLAECVCVCDWEHGT